MLKYIVSDKPKPASTKHEYKLINCFEKRQKESAKVLVKYPDKIPVIVERSSNSNMPDIDKHKYIIPKDFVVSKLTSQNM